MAKQPIPQGGADGAYPRPIVYKIMIALALWFALSAWAFFSGGSDGGLVLIFVSVPILMAIGIPHVLWRVSRQAHDSEAASTRQDGLGDWVSPELAARRSRRRTLTAAVEALLPLAAVAFGMTAIGIVLHFTAGGAG